MMLDDRFWSKVEIGSDAECWTWTANRNNKGYGLFRPGGLSPKQLAHRLSFEDRFGPIPQGALILHSCDNPSCVNPAHLRIGTHKENVADMDSRGRRVPTKLRGEKSPNAAMTDAQVLSLRKEYVAGVPLDTLYQRYGCTRSAFHEYTSGRAWKHLFDVDGCPSLGELKAESRRRIKSSAKLDEDKVREIRRRIAKGEAGKDIAAAFGVHAATISDIKLRKIWADV